MAYGFLITGILITIISAIMLVMKQKTEKDPDKAVEVPVKPFPDIFTHNIESIADARVLYELKEKVEMQLAELRDQKEMVTYLMMRVEKKLEMQEAASTAVLKKDPVQIKEKEKESLPNDGLERARLHNDIYLLYDQGILLVDIARQLGRGKGEVQLVLGLRDKEPLLM